MGYWTASNLAMEFHGRVVGALVGYWDAERQDRKRRNRRDYEFEHEFVRHVSRFVLKLQVHDALALCEPLLAAVCDHSDDTAQFVRWLIVEEDNSDGETPFWEVWQGFADRFSEAPWIEKLDSRNTLGTELLKSIFLGIQWNEGVRHWKRLEGQAERIDALVTTLPASAAVLRAYCRFLSEIGERSLPNGFVVVAERLKSGNPSTMLAADDTVLCLEALLRRYVYGEPLRLKSNPQVRTAVLQILDDLVETGSSAAFQMRDDFVTPIGSRS
jgi:hypothetical protein